MGRGTANMLPANYGNERIAAEEFEGRKTKRQMCWIRDEQS